MAGGKYMGPWGKLGGEVKGVVVYGLSPNRQRAFAGVTEGIRYMLTKRILGLGYVAAGLLPWYLAYQYTADLFAKNHRKNPEGFSRAKGY